MKISEMKKLVGSIVNFRNGWTNETFTGEVISIRKTEPGRCQNLVNIRVLGQERIRLFAIDELEDVGNKGA